MDKLFVNFQVQRQLSGLCCCLSPFSSINCPQKVRLYLELLKRGEDEVACGWSRKRSCVAVCYLLYICIITDVSWYGHEIKSVYCTVTFLAPCTFLLTVEAETQGMKGLNVSQVILYLLFIYEIISVAGHWLKKIFSVDILTSSYKFNWVTWPLHHHTDFRPVLCNRRSIKWVMI